MTRKALSKELEVRVYVDGSLLFWLDGRAVLSLQEVEVLNLRDMLNAENLPHRRTSE